MTARPIDRLQRPLRDLRLSLIDSCNYRCSYCMPRELFGEDYAFLGQDQLLSIDLLERAVAAFVACGVEKVKLTGGEPTLRDGLVELVGRLSRRWPELDLALVSNGQILEGLLKPLRQAGLKRLTISVDSVDEATYQAMNGRGYRLAPVLRAVETARSLGFAPIKINMVVVRGVNDGDVEQAARFFAHEDFRLRFIEYMDVGNRNRWKPEDVVPSRELLSRLRRIGELTPVEASYRGEVAKRYAWTGSGSLRGEIGFISSVSEPFCGDCTRARLSAEGKLYTCLFTNRGHDLKGALTAGVEEAANAVRSIWRAREDRYSQLRGKTVLERKVEMYQLGG